MLTITLIFFVTLFIPLLFLRRKNQSKYSKVKNDSVSSPQPLKSIPSPPYSLPFFGHALQLGRDPETFLQSCYLRYGPVFKLKLFHNTVGFFGDSGKLVHEILKCDEGKLSFYEIMESTLAIGSKGVPISSKISAVKKATTIPVCELVDGMSLHSRRLVERIHAQIGQNGQNVQIGQHDLVDLKKEFSRLMVSAVADLLIGVEMGEEMLKEFDDYSDLIFKHAFTSRVLPYKWMVEWIFGKETLKERPAIWAEFKKLIETYRDNPGLKEKPVLRAAVDTINLETGEKLGDADVCNSLMGLLFAATGNATLSLLHAILELAKTEKHWNLAKEEAERLLQKDDGGGPMAINNSKLLTSIVVEATRLNTSMIIAERIPLNKKSIGDYDISDLDIVSIPGWLNTVGGRCDKIFEESREFRPTRFFNGEDGKQNITPVISWGLGNHICTGKMYALAIIKIALAHFLTNFRVDLDKTTISGKMTMNLSALNSHEVMAKLIPINNKNEI